MPKPPRRVFEFPEDKPEIAVEVEQRQPPEVWDQQPANAAESREERRRASTTRNHRRHIESYESGGVPAPRAVMVVAYLFVKIEFVRLETCESRIPVVRMARIMSDPHPTLVSFNEQWLEVGQSIGRDYGEAERAMRGIMGVPNSLLHAWLPFLNTPVPPFILEATMLRTPVVIRDPDTATDPRGRNADALVMRVAHGSLRRLGDSRFTVGCPTCSIGVLTCARDAEGLLLRSDRCTSCGQRFFYTDDLIAGESLVRIRNRNRLPRQNNIVFSRPRDDDTNEG